MLDDWLPPPPAAAAIYHLSGVIETNVRMTEKTPPT
jgi:hypothetical protein